MMKYRILAEHKYMLETYIEAETVEQAEQLAAKLTILDYDLMERTVDEMDNEDLTIVNIQLED